MAVFLNILLFVFLLGFIVFVHEFCHFIAAKKANAKIEEFCIGFPPRIYQTKKGKIRYSIGIIPWGGFVKILGEDPTEKQKKGSFYTLSFWQRFWIILAGVISNFLLAIILFTIVFSLGYPKVIESEKDLKIAKDISIQIIYVEKNSPAEKAGLAVGDKILKMESKKEKIYPKEVKDVQNFTKKYLGQKITIEIKRKNKVLSLDVVPRKNIPKGQGPIGIMLEKTGIVKYSIIKSFILSFKISFNYTKLTFWGLGKLIKDAILGTKTPGIELTGPIGAGNFFSKIANLGLVYIINFAAIISLSLGIFNALPFPALDGGRLLFLLIEKIKRSPINPKIEKTVNQIGFCLLIILAIIIAIKDIRGLF